MKGVRFISIRNFSCIVPKTQINDHTIRILGKVFYCLIHVYIEQAFG